MTASTPTPTPTPAGTTTPVPTTRTAPLAAGAPIVAGDPMLAAIAAAYPVSASDPAQPNTYSAIYNFVLNAINQNPYLLSEIATAPANFVTNTNHQTGFQTVVANGVTTNDITISTTLISTYYGYSIDPGTLAGAYPNFGAQAFDNALAHEFGHSDDLMASNQAIASYLQSLSNLAAANNHSLNGQNIGTFISNVQTALLNDEGYAQIQQWNADVASGISATQMRVAFPELYNRLITVAGIAYDPDTYLIAATEANCNASGITYGTLTPSGTTNLIYSNSELSAALGLANRYIQPGDVVDWPGGSSANLAQVLTVGYTGTITFTDPSNTAQPGLTTTITSTPNVDPAHPNAPAATNTASIVNAYNGVTTTANYTVTNGSRSISANGTQSTSIAPIATDDDPDSQAGPTSIAINYQIVTSTLPDGGTSENLTIYGANGLVSRVINSGKKYSPRQSEYHGDCGRVKMGRGRPLPELALTSEERERLMEWTRRRKSAQALALRARIVLACTKGELNGDVAERLHVSIKTVGKWRSRFVAQRLNGSMACWMRHALVWRVRSAMRKSKR